MLTLRLAKTLGKKRHAKARAENKQDKTEAQQVAPKAKDLSNLKGFERSFYWRIIVFYFTLFKKLEAFLPKSFVGSTESSSVVTLRASAFISFWIK